MTLAIPPDLKRKLEKYPEINWSEVARQAFMQKVKDLEFLKELKQDNEMTEEQAVELGRKLRKRITKRIKNE